ncbi:Protein FAR1-RELATED SEQUENCE 5 [Bienertia sinuspersici]
MTREKGGLIETMQESGLRPMESYRYMITEAGGEDCIGHTIRDHLNYCNRLKMKPIEGGDAQAVIDKLYQNMSDDLEFFFRVHVDGYGRVSSIFWRDSMMKEDYNIYGDVTNLTQHTGQTAEVYTHTLFRHFEQEFEASMTSEVTKCSVIGNMLLYEVRIEDNNNRLSKSLTYKYDETITCTCKCFEETGLLCYHAIRILHGNSVKRIPEIFYQGGQNLPKKKYGTKLRHKRKSKES